TARGRRRPAVPPGSTRPPFRAPPPTLLHADAGRAIPASRWTCLSVDRRPVRCRRHAMPLSPTPGAQPIDRSAPWPISPARSPSPSPSAPPWPAACCCPAPRSPSTRSPRATCSAPRKPRPPIPRPKAPAAATRPGRKASAGSPRPIPTATAGSRAPSSTPRIRTRATGSPRSTPTAMASSTRPNTTRTRRPARPTWKASAAKASAAAWPEPSPGATAMIQAVPALAEHAAGLGLRRGLLPALQAVGEGAFDYLECAPENWIGVGGRLGDTIQALAERYPLTCHGLSLSLGGPAPLDETFVARVGRFLERHRVPLYSEHLSWCSDDGHLYDLLPLPFTEEAVEYVAARIRRVQDILGRRIAVENVSYYATLPVPAAQALDEADFVNAVLERADCDLLLDVNNIHVNAVNHRYDAHRFLRRMPSARIACYHVAGHHDEAPGLKV